MLTKDCEFFHSLTLAATNKPNTRKTMAKSTLDLMQLAGLGTNLVIDASQKSTTDLIQIAGSIGLKGGHLRIINCSKKSTIDLMQIVSVYPKNITLDFTESNQ